MKLNFTQRGKIPSGAVIVALNESSGTIPTFDADLSGLKKLGLDPACKVILEPYVVSTSMRFDCGLVGDPHLPLDRRLTDLDQGGSIRFRVLVINEAMDPCRIVAAGKVSTGATEEVEQARSILALTETPSLGQRVWKLDFDDDELPELLLNSQIPGLKARLLNEPLIQGLVLPAVMRDLLAEAFGGDAPDDAAWVKNCVTLARELTGQAPPDSEGVEEYIDDCVQAFCKKNEFVDRFVQSLKGKDDG